MVYGQIEVCKSHHLSKMNIPFKISPYFQEIQLYLGQQLDYKSAAQTSKKILITANVDDSQINRLCNYYGNLEATKRIVKEAKVIGVEDQKREKEELIYTGIDGHFLSTDLKWKEVKLGRIFSSNDIKFGLESSDIQRVRNQIEHSNYIAHLGDNKQFTKDLDELLTSYLSKKQSEDSSYKIKMVLLSDGAIWIDNWQKHHKIEWIAILDYYHVCEKLHELSKLFCSKKKRENWANEKCALLLEGEFDQVINEIKILASKNKIKNEKKDKLINHFIKNRQRMDYPKFIAQGLYIGSGCIESSHKYVSQKRMKMSGQRWGNGAQAMLNLRCCSCSNKWDNIIDLVKSESFKKTA